MIPTAEAHVHDLQADLKAHIAAREAAGLPADLAELVGLLDTFREHHLGCLEEGCPCRLLAGDVDVGLRPRKATDEEGPEQVGRTTRTEVRSPTPAARAAAGRGREEPPRGGSRPGHQLEF